MALDLSKALDKVNQVTQFADVKKTTLRIKRGFPEVGVISLELFNSTQKN